MDQALVDLAGGGEANELRFTVVDEVAGEVEVETGEGVKRYRLKALSELYGAGSGAETVDPTSERFMPLFLAIEERIVREYGADRSVTDATALLALDRLGMNPEGDAGGDKLVLALQLDLRLLLSLDDYSRQEVRAAVRKIGKSVARHTREAGPRGYLTFIRAQLGRV